MKGIYLTEEGKKEIKAKIAERLRIDIDDYYGQAALLKEILESAIILPVFLSWEDAELFPPDNESQAEKILKIKNGVIIQSK